MEAKIRTRYIDHGFGFQVILRHVPMVKVRGEWTPAVDYNLLAKEVLMLLARLDGRLTGNQVKFIRQHFELTLQQFAERFAVTHPAVHKWERAGDRPTGMNWGTEKDIRLFVLNSIERRPQSLCELYQQLERAAPDRAVEVEVDAKKLAA